MTTAELAGKDVAVLRHGGSSYRRKVDCFAKRPEYRARREQECHQFRFHVVVSFLVAQIVSYGAMGVSRPAGGHVAAQSVAIFSMAKLYHIRRHLKNYRIKESNALALHAIR